VRDDVAVPALGQTNFLLFLFGWFFISISSDTLLVYLDLRFLLFSDMLLLLVPNDMICKLGGKSCIGLLMTRYCMVKLARSVFCKVNLRS
jgi:hypothetical protein